MANIKDIEVSVEDPLKQILINQIRMEAKINVLTDLVAAILMEPGSRRDKEELFKKIDDSIKDQASALLLKLQNIGKASIEHSDY